MTDDQSAENVLKSIHDAQAAAGDAFSRYSWSYDILYSLLLAVFVAIFALPFRWQPLSWAVTSALLALLAVGWARKHGVWISGVKPKRARWIAGLLGLVMAVIILATLVASREGVPLFAAPAAVVVFVAALVGSRWWRAVYRREMGLPM